MNDLYTFTVPIFIKTLGGLRGVLEKAEVFVKERGVSEQEFLGKQFWPDMFPLKKQVQVACDNAKLGVMRLTGTEMSKVEDTEETFTELLSRIDKTTTFLKAVSESSYEEAAERQITLSYFPGKYLTGGDYVRAYLIPNFFFHVVTAYDLVRTQGVPVGKADYSNGLPFKNLSAA